MPSADKVMVRHPPKLPSTSLFAGLQCGAPALLYEGLCAAGQGFPVVPGRLTGRHPAQRRTAGCARPRALLHASPQSRITRAADASSRSTCDTGHWRAPSPDNDGLAQQQHCTHGAAVPRRGQPVCQSAASPKGPAAGQGWHVQHWHAQGHLPKVCTAGPTPCCIKHPSNCAGTVCAMPHQVHACTLTMMLHGCLWCVVRWLC